MNTSVSGDKGDGWIRWISRWGIDGQMKHQSACHFVIIVIKLHLPAEAAADYPEFIDNRCCQDVGTGVCRRSAWLLQQSTVRCTRGTPAMSAECPERGSSVHHWYSEIRLHHASVAQPSLVASATKNNFQDRHSDVPMFEWTGTFLSGSRLHRSFFCDTRSETIEICHLRAAVHSRNQNSDIWTEVIQGLWSNNLEWSSRQDERSIFEFWLISRMLETFLFDKWLLQERICGSCINLRGEMFITIIIISACYYLFCLKPTQLHIYLNAVVKFLQPYKWLNQILFDHEKEIY